MSQMNNVVGDFDVLAALLLPFGSLLPDRHIGREPVSADLRIGHSGHARVHSS
jgi:hypothetical protein